MVMTVASTVAITSPKKSCTISARSMYSAMPRDERAISLSSVPL